MLTSDQCSFFASSPPDQSDADHFCPVWVGDLASQWQTGLAVCDTNWRRQTTWSKTTSLTQSTPKIEVEPSVQLPVTRFHLQISSPQEKKIFNTYHCLQEVCCFWTIRDFAISSNRGNCLVPKLNWRMHCNSNCFYLSVSLFFFLFIMLLSYKVYV